MGLQGEVLLGDADQAARGLPGEVHIEAGPGADDDVGVESGQPAADPLVGEAGCTAGSGIHAAGKTTMRLRVQRMPALVRRVLPAHVDKVLERDPRVERQLRRVEVPEDGGDLDLVSLVGEGGGQVEGRTDRSAQCVGVVKQE